MRSRKPVAKIVYKYKVLAANQLSELDRATALAEAKTVLTGDQAQALQGVGYWGCFTADVLGHVKILRYKGVDAVLYYKRLVLEVEPFPGDPLPIGTLEEPRDVWARLELFGAPVRKVADLSTRERLRLQNALREALASVVLARRTAEEADSRANSALALVAQLREELKTARSSRVA